MQLSSDPVHFYLFYDKPVDMQIWALLTRSQFRVSDTLVTVKVHGPLVYRSQPKEHLLVRLRQARCTEN